MEGLSCRADVCRHRRYGGGGAFPALDGGEDRHLRLYSSLDVHLALPLIEGFQRLHPDIAVSYDELLTAPLADRVIEETDAGGPTADLIFSSAMDLS